VDVLVVAGAPEVRELVEDLGRIADKPGRLL